MSPSRESDSLAEPAAAAAATTAEGERRRVIRSAGVVSVAVLASRALGLVRVHLGEERCVCTPARGSGCHVR